MSRRVLSALAMAALLGAAGCATTGSQTPAASASASAPAAKANPADPWENWNRKVYKFNDAIDTALIRPVATVYANVVPQPVRTGVTNFYGNFADMWSAVNNLLQLKFADSAHDVIRVGTNTVFGVAGLFDIATDMGIDSKREDFGQTLGHWGVGAGPYIVWPLLGPSTLRDSAALPLDRYVGPGLAFGDAQTQYSLIFLGLLNERANLLPTSRMLDDMALDKYIFVRDAYLQRRQSLVHDGNEPDEDAGESADAFEPDADAGPAQTVVASVALPVDGAASSPLAPSGAASAPGTAPAPAP